MLEVGDKLEVGVGKGGGWEVEEGDSLQILWSRADLIGNKNLLIIIIEERNHESGRHHRTGCWIDKRWNVENICAEFWGSQCGKSRLGILSGTMQEAVG